MRKLFWILLFVSFAALGQLDTVDLSITYFGVPSIAGQADFMRNEAYKMNQGMLSIDSLNAFIDVTDSSAVFTTVEIDSLSVGSLYYKDSFWDDLRIPLTNSRINPANSEPDFESIGNGAFAWGFDPNSDSAYALHFIAQLPHRYKIGTDIEAHIHWVPPSTNTGTVRWKLSYWLAAIDGTMAGPYYLWVNDAGDGTAYKHQLAQLGTISGSTLSISSMIVGRIARLGALAADDFTGSAYGLEIDFHFRISSPGSQGETLKW